MNVEVKGFEPQHAEQVIATFRTVYGDDYPVDMVYDPAYWIRDNAGAALYTYVALAEDGRLAGLVSFYQVAPFSGLYESGQLAVGPEFRKGGTGMQLAREASRLFALEPAAAAAFCEMGCHWTVSQSISHQMGYRDVSFEVGLFPSQTYAKEHDVAGRVSAIIAYQNFRERRHAVYLPTACRELLEYCYSDLGLQRDFPQQGLGLEGLSRVQTTYLAAPAVARLNFHECGADFASRLDELEDEFLKQGAQVLQLILNLEDGRCPAAAALAQGRNYHCCGLLPRWFDGDGVLLQRNLQTPAFGHDKIASPKGKELASRIASAWK